jgi:FMN-dependent dehydrogenase
MTSPPSAFGDYQLEIYGDGLRGVLPAFPMAYAELEARAARALSPSVLSYVAGGAGVEHTQRANVSAFRRWGLVPRMFVGAPRPRASRASSSRSTPGSPAGARATWPPATSRNCAGCAWPTTPPTRSSAPASAGILPTT